MGTPIDAITYGHKGMRSEIAALEGLAKELVSAGDAPSARLAGEFSLLRTVVKGHTTFEEEVLFPAFEAKASLSCVPYLHDHEAESELFSSIEGLLADLQDGNGAGRSEVAWKLNRQIVALNATLTLHSRKEDTHLFPVAKERFSVEEQLSLAGQAARFLPQEMMPQILPRVIRALTVDEQEDYLRMLMGLVPPPVFGAMAGWVKAGISAQEWTTLAGRIPQLA